MNAYKRHRLPPDIISYAVWLYYRFNLSHRDLEDLLAQRISPSVVKESVPGASNLAPSALAD
jgi:putative transposase